MTLATDTEKDVGEIIGQAIGLNRESCVSTTSVIALMKWQPLR